MPYRREGWKKWRGGGGWVENSSKLNKRKWDWNKPRGWEILENSIVGWGVEEILLDVLKPNSKKLKCFGFLSFFKINKFLNQMHSFRH